MLQDEKYRAEKDSKEREVLGWQKTDNLQAELQMLNDTLANRQRDLKDIDAELYAYKSLLDEKNGEIARLKKDLTGHEEESFFLSKEKRAVEGELLASRDSRLVAQNEVDTLAAGNERLAKEKAMIEERARATELDALRLRSQIGELETRLAIAKKDRAQKEAELDIVLDGKKTIKEDANKLSAYNGQLSGESQDLSNSVKSLELQLARARQKCDDSFALLDAKEKELARAKSGLTYSEDRSLNATAEFRKLRQDNETLQRLLDSYRKDVDFQKKLREIEATKKLEVELEKRKLENEALSKDLEARSAKKELEKVKDHHDQILEDKYQLNQELNALKEHTDILESQNTTVWYEYDKK